ncbi:CorA family magnesium transporter [Candidatus Gracilibacteria bacterium]|nr:CorA family magnesium transporter [Candidatus Gracilibacteria bacterium]
MNSLHLNSSGKVQEKNLSRKELAILFQIHSRDLRPVFTKKQVATIMPRGGCIIVSIRSVKIIIGTKEVFIFNLEKKKIPEYFVPILIEKIEAWKTNKEKTRFEHLVLDATLNYWIDKIQRRFEDIERASELIFQKLGAESLSDSTFEQLLHLKKRLSKLDTNVEEIETEITELVEDDDDLADLYLGIKKPNDTDEIESILESALEQIEDTSHRVEDLKENIDDTQEILTLKLDSMRNIIIKFDLLVTAVTCVLALLAVITGMYGMNLKSGIEQNPDAFWAIGWILVALFIIALGFLIGWLKRKKII